MVEDSTWVALADILMHQFREKKEKKDSKSLPPLPPLPLIEIERAFALYFDGAYKRKEGSVRHPPQDLPIPRSGAHLVGPQHLWWIP